MNDSRKRPLPSSAPGFPSKRASRLLIGMDRLDLNRDEEPSSQRTALDNPLSEAAAGTTAQPAQVAAEALSSASSSSVVYAGTAHSHTEHYASHRSQMILSRLAHPALPSSLASDFSQHTVLPSIRKYPTDPRDIKNGDTQRRYAQAIAEYLENIGFKEFVPQYRNVRSLSSKDFHYIYTHLVQHYDPSLRHKHKIEDHVIEIMNSLKYPLRESISRKSLLSIGAIHSNANFYGLLHWLMEACKSRDVSNPKEFKDLPLATLEIEENAMSSACAEFAFATYRKYISSEEEPTYDEEMDPLKTRFEEIAEERGREIHQLDADIAALKEEVNMLESDGSTIEELKKKNHDLTRDSVKFRNYCQEKRKRVDKYRSINKVVEDEVNRLSNEYQKLDEQRVELETKLLEKNVSLADLESLTKEHEAETKKCADLTAHLETRQLAYNEKMETLTVLKDKVRKQVDEFNVKVKKVFPTGQEQHEFLLVYNPGAKTANEMLSYDVDQKLISILETLEVTEREGLDQLTIETQRLREKSDTLKTDIDQTKMDLIEKQREAEIKARKLEEGRHQFREENEKYNIMTEKHEKALDDERSRSRDSLLQAKDRLFAEEERWQDMVRRFEQEQQVLSVTAKNMVSQYENDQEELIPKIEALKLLVLQQEHITE